MSQILLLLIILLISNFVSPQYFCRTPGKKMGRCVSIYDCDYLLDILKSNMLTQQSIRFLQLSQCDATEGIANTTPHVCCARNDDNLTSQFNINSPPASSALFTSAQTLREEDDSIVSSRYTDDRMECGREMVEHRIYSGQDTLRNEFPWTALLVYRKFSGENSINCGGSLINKYYILTAAHCLTGDIIARIGPLDHIRLGDHDLRKSPCGMHQKNCMNQHNEIDEIIPHKGFDPRTINRRNDIGLVRLKNSVKFNDLVQPVCLPSLNAQHSLKTGDSVYVVGFGRTLTSKTSPIKQKLKISIYNHDECKKKFALKNVEIHDDQLCAGGEFSKDACDGDSGNGLVRFKGNWIIEGIVSFGYLCGIQDWPAIYTKVESYSNWIEKNMRL